MKIETEVYPALVKDAYDVRVTITDKGIQRQKVLTIDATCMFYEAMVDRILSDHLILLKDYFVKAMKDQEAKDLQKRENTV